MTSFVAQSKFSAELQKPMLFSPVEPWKSFPLPDLAWNQGNTKTFQLYLTRTKLLTELLYHLRLVHIIMS